MAAVSMSLRRHRRGSLGARSSRVLVSCNLCSYPAMPRKQRSSALWRTAGGRRAGAHNEWGGQTRLTAASPPPRQAPLHIERGKAVGRQDVRPLLSGGGGEDREAGSGTSGSSSRTSSGTSSTAHVTDTECSRRTVVGNTTFYQKNSFEGEGFVQKA